MIRDFEGSDKFCNIHDILSGNLLTKISDDYSAGLNDCAWFGDNHIVTIGDDCSIRLVDIAAVSMYCFIRCIG